MIKIALPKGRFCDRSLAIIANSVNKSVCDIKKSKKLVFESEDYVFFILIQLRRSGVKNLTLEDHRRDLAPSLLNLPQVQQQSLIPPAPPHNREQTPRP